MALTRLQMQSAVYDILSKNAASAGLLTPAKVNDAIQDALDFLQSKMMKIGGIWLSDVQFVNYVANNPLVTPPTGLVMVNFIKWATAADTTSYVPINFDENATGSTSTAGSSLQGNLPSWRWSTGGAIRLEPMPNTSLTNGVMFDGIFLKTLAGDSDTFAGDLACNIFTQYIKWRTASILRSYTTKDDPPWLRIEKEWEMQAMSFIARKHREPNFSAAYPNY